MWLLDANMDVHRASTLTSRGIACDMAGNRGWKALSNGELVRVAVSVGFTCLLTRDRLFGQSASRALRSYPAFAVVLVTLPQQPWAQYRERFLEYWAQCAIAPVAGQLTEWPTTAPQPPR